MKKLIFLPFLLLFTCISWAQTPTQIKQIIPGTPSVVFNWTYNVTDEQYMDSFVLQRTAYGATSTITSPYDIEIVISQKTIRSATHTLPTPAPTAGQSAFYRMIARKQGLSDSAPSNVVQISVVPTPPIPGNLSIAGITTFTEVEFTKHNVNGVKLWTVSGLL